MKEQLFETLKTICPNYPVVLTGTFAEGEPLPDTFITFWTLASPTERSFDNSPALTRWEFQVTLYSNDPSLILTESARIVSELRLAGFIPDGRGFDFPCTDPNHTAWIIRLNAIERIN